MKILTSLLAVNISLLASVCNIDNALLSAIEMQERHAYKEVGYPYLISFNNKSEAKKLKKTFEQLKGEWLDNRTFDCKESQNCIKITKALVTNGYKNLDLGHLQFCYTHHTFEISEYFDPKRSKQRACKYLYSLKNQFGWSWKTVARYHSSTPELNSNYKKMIIANYEKVINRVEKNSISNKQ